MESLSIRYGSINRKVLGGQSYEKNFFQAFPQIASSSVFFVCGLFWTTFAQAVTTVEYLTPTSNSSPADLAFDDESNVWFAEMGHYFKGRFRSKTGKLVP
jgi:streptogramin lyase